MRRVIFTLVVLSSVVHAAGISNQAGVPSLIPKPKQLRWLEQAPMGAQDCAIVLGKAADPVEHYAAEFLQARVEKRFGVKWPVITEDEDSRHKFTILLGGRNTNQKLKALCDRQKIGLSESSPGWDGYVIEPVSIDGRTYVLVAGSNSRGTLYGTDTLFQMIQGEKNKPVLYIASIRDYPTVPWRGRPQTDVSQHLQPGVMDCYAASRINFIDLRKGIYAYEPGHKFSDKDKAEIAATLKEAHRRGIIVLGAVNCGIPRRLHQDASKTFEQFIAFGADGIWLSFDDKGPGETPEELTFDMLGLAKRHGIPANYIAITPPKGSYQVIQAPFNAKIMKVPGMEQAMWFWTTVPSAEVYDQAKALGIKVMPSWWHNWPRPKSGLTHVGEGSQLIDGRSYLPMPSMAAGWHQPDYVELAAGAKYLHAIMPWGGNAWLQWYITPVIGWWGWDAEMHDWDATRARAYDIVFGSSQVKLAAEFDDTLTQIKTYFVYNEGRSEPEGFRPARFKNPSDSQKVLALLGKLESLLGQIDKKAAEQTLLNREVLQTQALEAMRAEVQTGKIAAQLDFPEYWWDEHQRAVLSAVYDQQFAKAEQLIAQGNARVRAELAPIGEQLTMLRQIRGYVGKWTRIADRDLTAWQQVIADRKTELPRRAWQCGFYTDKLSDLLKEANNPPLGRGYGAGQRGLRILASVIPTDREQYRGQWVSGALNLCSTPVAAFGIDIRDSCTAGDYGELPVTLPISGPRDRLGLMVFMNRSTKDSFGLELVPERWSGYASAQIVWGEQILWEADLGLSRTGHEWDVVRLPRLPENVKELQLRLRVVDRKDSSFARTFVLVGPIRLVELPD